MTDDKILTIQSIKDKVAEANKATLDGDSEAWCCIQNQLFECLVRDIANSNSEMAELAIEALKIFNE